MIKIVTLTWRSNDMFHYMLKAEFVKLVSLNVPSGSVVTDGVPVPSFGIPVLVGR